jgi:hypothetical protein
MQILKWDSLKILSQTFVRSNTSFLFTYLLHHSIPREDRLFPKERGTYYLGEEGGAVTCLQSLPWEPVSFTCCSRKREKVSPGIPHSWPPEEGHTTQNGHRLEGTFENPFKVKLVGLIPFFLSTHGMWRLDLQTAPGQQREWGGRYTAAYGKQLGIDSNGVGYQEKKKI